MRTCREEYDGVRRDRREDDERIVATREIVVLLYLSYITQSNF